MDKISSERIINGEIGLNSCGTQTLFDHDYHVVRSRVDYTIMYLASGKASVKVNGQTQTVGIGDAMFFPPNVRQEYTFLAEDKSINMWIHFSGKLCSKLDGQPVRIVHLHDRQNFEDEFDRLIKACYGISDERELLCNGYLMVLLARLFESINRQTQPVKLSEQRITDVLSYIHINVCGNIDWDECAKICCLGRDRFNHVFKNKVGVSPKEYHKLIKVKQAKKLLSDVGMTVSECAEAMGYNDTNYFCRFFKKETGYTPSQYRQKKTDSI